MQPKSLKPRPAKSAEQALSSLMRLCSRAEKSASDARRLMRGWGVAAAEAEQVLERLQRDRFIDDNRYAEAFVREKLRLSGWGALKIRAALQRKGIDRSLVDEALTQASPEAMGERLEAQLRRKARTVNHATPYELKTKLIRYGISLGYDYPAVLEAAAAITGDTDSCDEF